MSLLQTPTKPHAYSLPPNLSHPMEFGRIFARALKRGFDLALAVTLLVICAPFFIPIALFIRSDGGPVFFKHRRIGKNGKPFDCYKFRSMSDDAEAMLARHLLENPQAAAEWGAFQKLKNDIRITRFGRLLRRLSIDELPQLLNVLKGDMSFVGPRPCTADQENLYAADFNTYRSVHPGITGPWQVSGRNKLTFEQRVALESAYVRDWNLRTDMVILLKTLPTIFKKDEAF